MSLKLKIIFLNNNILITTNIVQNARLIEYTDILLGLLYTARSEIPSIRDYSVF